MLGLAALLLATASPASSPALTSNSPWWERYTFTMRGDGSQQSCRYQTSLPNFAQEDCSDASESPSLEHRASASDGSFTKITIERRFNPGVEPGAVKLQPGDTLLGGQLMAIAIDQAGAVKSCEVVGTAGRLKSPYGCADARTERFEANPIVRHAYMTVLVYGHEEYPV